MKTYLNASELMELIPVGKTQAYEIIRELNAELRSKNFRTVRGKIPSRYVLERFGITNLEEGR